MSLEKQVLRVGDLLSPIKMYLLRVGYLLSPIKKHLQRVSNLLSPITRRILAVNLLALGFLFAGMFYVDLYRRAFIDAGLAALQAQATLFAGALANGAIAGDASSEEGLVADVAQRMLRRLVYATGNRARLFSRDGELLADSRLSIGPGGMVETMQLPPPRDEGRWAKAILSAYDRIVKHQALPVYGENEVQRAADYTEALEALSGNVAEIVRSVTGGGMILSVAVPVQRYGDVLGALMLTRASQEIDQAVFEVRLSFLKVFAVALAVTVLLSLYLAGTITRPIQRLARAASSALDDPSPHYAIPDLSHKRDEIGILSAAIQMEVEKLKEHQNKLKEREEKLTELEEFVESTKNNDGIFISYSSADANFVSKITEKFEKDKIPFWRDDKDMLDGDIIHDAISDGIERNYIFLIILTPNSINSKWVKMELQKAVFEEVENKKRIIPVIAKGLTLNSIPASIRHRKCRVFSGNFDADYGKLRNSIRAHLQNYAGIQAEGAL